eukprot:6176638-Pleurochrysis_carterae.AAC.5
MPTRYSSDEAESEKRPRVGAQARIWRARAKRAACDDTQERLVEAVASNARPFHLSGRRPQHAPISTSKPLDFGEERERNS